MRKAGDGSIAARTDPDVVSMAAQIVKARLEERQAAVATAAYFRAQRRGFEPGHELDDWLAAEAELALGPASVEGMSPEESAVRS
jgi:hypothetical protein